MNEAMQDEPVQEESATSAANEETDQGDLAPVPSGRVHPKPDILPGTLMTRTGTLPARVRLLTLGTGKLQAEDPATQEQITKAARSKRLAWVDVYGPADAETVRSLGEIFNLHPLTMEDLINTFQRPKVEAYPEHQFIVLRVPQTAEDAELETAQVSIVLGDGFLLTVQDRANPCLDGLWNHVLEQRGRFAQKGADYLAAHAIDAAVDRFFPPLERLEGLLDAFEERLMSRSDARDAQTLHELRHDLRAWRRAVLPMRDALASLLRDEDAPFNVESRLYLRDAQDHAARLLDILDSLREMTSSLMELHLAQMSNGLNRVMGVLTVIATIFIPLTFIAGVYGMNFDTKASPWNMPELHWRYGYPLVMGVMVIIGFALFWMFRKRGWFK